MKVIPRIRETEGYGNISIRRNDNNIFTDAAKIVRQIAATDSDADDEIIDLAMSFDSYWMKRGHTSAHEIGCVIDKHGGSYDTVTGLVLDMTIRSVVILPSLFLCTSTVWLARHSLVQLSAIKRCAIAAYDTKWYLACVLNVYPTTKEIQLNFLHPEGPARSYHYPHTPDIILVDSRFRSVHSVLPIHKKIEFHEEASWTVHMASV